MYATSFYHEIVTVTLQALAKQVGVTRQMIISLEKNKYSPSLELAFRIALVFDEPLTAVFSYDLSDDIEQQITFTDN